MIWVIIKLSAHILHTLCRPESVVTWCALAADKPAKPSVQVLFGPPTHLSPSRQREYQLSSGIRLAVLPYRIISSTKYVIWTKVAVGIRWGVEEVAVVHLLCGTVPEGYSEDCLDD